MYVGHHGLLGSKQPAIMVRVNTVFIVLYLKKVGTTTTIRRIGRKFYLKFYLKAYALFGQFSSLFVGKGSKGSACPQQVVFEVQLHE